MKTTPIPEDLRSAPFEILRDFIQGYNKALAAGATDPERVARVKLVGKYAKGQGGEE